MLTVNTNTTSLITQMNLTRSNNCVQKSIERMSTGYRINRASDDAANMSISKNMSCQISGTDVALDNAQQAINLLQTADGTLDNMQQDLLRIRDLAVQASNGTYSAAEKEILQQEVNQRVEELYKQRNNATFNKINIFGDKEEPPGSLNSASSTSGVALASTGTAGSVGDSSGSGAAAATTSTATVGGTKPVTPLTEAEAIAQGYTCIKSEADFMKIKDDASGKYCLMCDIDFSKISGWGDVTLTGELNGNGYAVNNLTINSTTNSNMHGLFRESSGTIKNLTMNNVNIDSTNSYIGGLVGGGWSTKGTIDNCSVSGSIKGLGYAGGLVGCNYKGTITDCSSSGSVTGTGDCTGGLVGLSGLATITNCSSSATVTGNETTGGLVGYSYLGTITNSSSSGSVTGTTCTGGLVGYSNGIITDCSSSGSVTGTGDCTGGLVGYSNGIITDCSSSGSVTGTDLYTGGLVGENDKTITNCSSSGNVTGTDCTGGLVGFVYNGGTIITSYTKSQVNGANLVGGITGANVLGTITDSYSLGNISGDEYVGGAVGGNGGTTQNSYSTGTVTGTGTYIGGFVGTNGALYGSDEFEGAVSNSYTTSELDFYGINYKGTITDCHGTTTQTGVTAHDASWFEDGSNLTFLGDAYDTRYNPPDLKENSRGERLPVNITFQIGANSGEENTLTIDTGFSMNNYTADVRTLEAAQKTILETDEMSQRVSFFRATIGATQNRLESVMESLSTRKNNMEASHSTIVDTDFAAESSKLVQQQILQNVASSLLAQANTNPEIALKLLY